MNQLYRPDSQIMIDEATVQTLNNSQESAVLMVRGDSIQSVLETAKKESDDFLKVLSLEINKISLILEDHRDAFSQVLEAKFSDLATALNSTSTKLSSIETSISDQAEKITGVIKEKNTGLTTRLTNLTSKITDQSKVIKNIGISIETSTGNTVNEISKNRKLLILLILIASVSLLFNMAKFMI